MFSKGKGVHHGAQCALHIFLRLKKITLKLHNYVVGFKPVKSSNCAHATKTIAKCFALFRANWNELRASSSDIFL